MFGLLDALKRQSETAFRGALMLAAAGGLIVIAAGFLAGALVVGLADHMPLWAALLCGAGGLLILALIALTLAKPKHRATPAPTPSTAQTMLGLAASSGSLKDLILRLAEHEARTNPAAAAAIAAAAGLLLGALEGRAAPSSAPHAAPKDRGDPI